MTNLLLNVVKRVRAVDGEADEDDVGVGVAQRAQTIIVFLTGRIPKREFDTLPIDFYVCDVVLEHGGHVNLVVAAALDTRKGMISSPESGR